jgi:D-3-phosphoglycerate dehydrogenase / 2-oxoglutarate reductase
MTRRTMLAIGDSYLPVAQMAEHLDGWDGDVDYRSVTVVDGPPIERIREHQGDPAQISDWLGATSILLVHAAAVPAMIFEQHPTLEVVACARGNPVNVDLAAAHEHGVTVLHTPAKNAVAVADLTMASTLLLLRRAVPAARWLTDRAASGERHLDSTFAGGAWMATEPRGLTIGIIGFGAVGRAVAEQAERYGMRVLAFDPFQSGDDRLVELDELVATSDVVSIHAPAVDETRHLVNRDLLAAMRRGAHLINTARESLLDEAAVLDALNDGHLAGAALDVCEPTGRWPELAAHPNVLVTPHIGGATRQTQDRAMSMLLDDLARIERGEPPLRVKRP